MKKFQNIENLDKYSNELLVILRKIGISQKDVASEMDVSPAAISKFFNINESESGLGSEKKDELISIFELQLSRLKYARTYRGEFSVPNGSRLSAKQLQAQQDTYVKDSIASSSRDTQGLFEDLEEHRINKLIKTSSRLSGQNISDLQKQVQGIKDKVNGRVPSSNLVAPGGIMSPTASNYVDRLDDDTVIQILTQGTAAASVVVGPINGGTSSFLNRVYHFANQIDGCSVVIVHMENGFPDGSTYNQFDFFKYLFIQIGLPKEVFEDNMLDSQDLRDEFENWAKANWVDNTRTVLIIDGLDQVFKTAKSVADALALVHWMTELRSATAYSEGHFNGLILFTALTGKTWSAAHASTFASQALELNIGKLSENKVVQVMQAHNLQLKDSELEEVMTLFNGHPYLVHLFAWSLHKHISFADAKQNALELDGKYQTHWDRMLRELTFLIGDESDLADVLNVIAELSENGGLSNLSKDALSLHRAYGASLRVFGLLDGSKYAPEICQFYLNAIKKELGTE